PHDRRGACDPVRNGREPHLALPRAPPPDVPGKKGGDRRVWRDAVTDEATIGRLAELLRALPPAPQGWVEAAQELPLAQPELDQIVARAEADAAFRAALVADLESALAEAGFRLEPRRARALRRR